MSALDCMAASPQRVADPNAQQMADMIRAFWISQIVGTFAQLAIPDHLAGGAPSSGELLGCSPVMPGQHTGLCERQWSSD
jgi:hypothetical protein